MKSETFLSRLNRISRELSEATAVVDENGSWTYGELARWSNAFAHLILAQKRDAGGFVVLMLPRTRYFVAATIGALKAGTAFVFVSPTYPADRVNTILAETKPIAFFTTSEIWDARSHALKIDERAVTSVDRMETAAVDVSPVDESRPEQDAFVLYTSGTTGKPKGVVHGMITLDAIVRDLSVRTPATARPRVATIADFGFIASIINTYRCLADGGELHLISDELRMDMERLAAYLNERRIDTTFMGSSMGVSMLKAYDLRLKNVRLGGEKIVGMTPEAAAKTKVINVYGMSELSPMTAHVVSGHEEVIPAGRPLAGTEIYVLDAQLKAVPAGTIGDVYGASDRMARRYLGMPELSAERFIENPFKPGTRLLRTGDRGYLTADGELVLSGRTDDMVKLRGLRIETGEIEAVTQSFAGIGATVCVVRSVGGEDQLCLYFESEGDIDRAALRDHLASKLAAYMIPSVFVRLEKLPRNSRGKLDRKALPEPTANDLQLKMEPVASDYESILYRLASQMLGTDRFGVTDDLFALGLSSLMTMKLVANAEKEGVKIKASDLMKCRTIRGTIQHGTSILEWYRPYDPKKDVMVFVCGVTLTVDIPKKLALFAEKYNVMTIEPIVEHYRYIFEGDDIEEITELYYALIDYQLPKGAKLKALAGSSWGGKLAYLIAGKWRERTGFAPTAILGDTIIGGDPTMAAALLNGTFYEWLGARGLDKAAFNSDFVRRQTVIARVESKHLPIPQYAGPVILIHARDHWVFPPENDKKWEKLALNLTILPVDANHNEISMDTPKGLPFWKRAVELS